MRLGWLTAACILIAAPAQADVTARYRIGPGEGVGEMVIEVDGHGDLRISTGPQAALVVRDGVSYVLAGDMHGAYVARYEDLTAIMVARIHAATAGFDAGRLPAIMPAPARSLERRGSETVGGRTGALWVVPGPGTARDSNTEVVISEDQDLAPIGRFVASQFQASDDFVHRAMGPFPLGNMFTGMADALRHGTPIRMGEILRLESVTAEAVPASDFALPGPPLDRAALEARIMPAPAPRAATP